MGDAFVTGAGLFALYMLGALTGWKVLELIHRIVSEVVYWTTEAFFWVVEIILDAGDNLDAKLSGDKK